MLIAEINGKRLPAAEGSEDWLTSAVFGHLRHVQPARFWPIVFERAVSICAGDASLAAELKRLDVSVASFSRISMTFWPQCGKYGEPDLMIRFSGAGTRPLLLVVEVKLNSGKSSVGEKDQLAKYLEMLDDPDAASDLKSRDDLRYLIYLTRERSVQELKDSVSWSKRADAEKRIFGLEWRDILEAAGQERAFDPLLEEVFLFLNVRGFAPFAGFHSLANLVQSSGAFYNSNYFLRLSSEISAASSTLSSGRFYWSQPLRTGSINFVVTEGRFYAK